MIFPMSDNWWVEKDKAYFCGTRLSALFCVNMSSLQCELVAWLPESDMVDFFVHPYCVKYKDSIICLPGTGKEIWSYYIKKKVWKKTEINNDGQLILSKWSYSQTDGRIWLLEYDTGKILQVDLDKKVVEKEFRLPRDGEKVSYGEYVLIQNKLYTVAGKRVYCIDTKEMDVTIYEVSGVKTGLYTICYDGLNFWLGGYCKEIYIWNPKQGLIKVLTKFPARFGIYHYHGTPDIDYSIFPYTTEEVPFFGYSFLLGKYVWYIPTQSNGIIYIDKETYEIHFLEIQEEWETKESLDRDYASKFLFEYIREDRYIGIYSIQNQLIFEVDTVMLSVKYKDFELSADAVLALAKGFGQYDGRRMFREKKKKDRLFFSTLLKANHAMNDIPLQNIGEQIYHTLDES